MRQLFLLLMVIPLTVTAQQHFSGMTTSSRTGMLNGGINPAEFANVPYKYTIHIISPSFVASSNKVGLRDFMNGEDIGDALFEGSDNTDLKIDGEIAGPGIAYRFNKWTIGISTRAYARLDVLDVDTEIGDAIVNENTAGILQNSFITNSENQRINGTTWGEIGFSVARTLVDNEKHAFNAGVTLKMLFPGSYANFGASNFEGTVTTGAGGAFLSGANAQVNIAYSGNLGEDFTDVNDYFSSLYGKLNGIAADIGVNYRLKDTSGNYGYKLNVGVSLRNIGSMTFKDSNNASTDYKLNIPDDDPLPLEQFEDVSSLKEIEQILLQSGYLENASGTRDFRVSLPTLFITYADVRIVPDFYVTGYSQWKVQKDRENNQIANENVVSFIPRYARKNVEAFLPLSFNEVSGFSAGFGFRAFGFFLGSSSAFTALSNDSKHADLYFGYGFSL